MRAFLSVSAKPFAHSGVSLPRNSHPMKNPWIFPVATLLVGAAGGYFSGKNSSSATAIPADGATIKTRSTSRSGSSVAEAAPKRAARAGGTDQIVRLPGSNNRIQALMDFYAGLTPGQLEEEARKLENLPMNERIMASFLLFGRWGESDPTAAMAFAGTMGFTGMFVRPTILQSWASVDPSNAAKYYAANPREFAAMGMMGGGRGPMGGQGGASIIAGEWAKQDPASALAWANALTTEKNQALEAVVGEVAKSDPAKASEMLASRSADGLDGAYRTVAARYGAMDFTEAQAWIRTLPAAEQAEALASAIGGLSNNDPEAAAKQVLAMEEGDARNRAVNDVVEDLARLDPQAAADFLKQQTSERSLREGMRELMPSWVAQNPTAALAFANSYQPGPVRDSALQSYVWSNNSAAPADLVKVAETITDEGDRNRTIGMTAMRWMREDETAAKAYVEQSTALSAEAKQRIIDGRGFWGGPGGGPGRGRRGGN
jgi:hypothetical protein